jgi:hypothetical protein
MYNSRELPAQLPGFSRSRSYPVTLPTSSHIWQVQFHFHPDIFVTATDPTGGSVKKEIQKSSISSTDHHRLAGSRSFSTRTASIYLLIQQIVIADKLYPLNQ